MDLTASGASFLYQNLEHQNQNYQQPNYNIKTSRIKLDISGLRTNSALHSNSTLKIHGMFTAGSINFFEAKQKYLKMQQVMC